MSSGSTFVVGKRGVAAQILREALKTDGWTDKEWREAQTYIDEFYAEMLRPCCSLEGKR